MARKNQGHIVRVYRTVARSELGLIVPALALVGAVWAAFFFVLEKLKSNAEATAVIDWRWAAYATGFLLLFPLWAKFKTRFFNRFTVTLDSVIEEHGFFGRTSSEIRIQDIRNIVVRQSLLDRLLAMGTVSFSSAAGDAVEVRFRKVSRPARVKDLVRDIQDKLSDGRLTDDEVAAISDRAWNRVAGSTARSKPVADSDPEDAGSADAGAGATATPAVVDSPRSSADGSDDGDEARDELYRLLSEQQAEGQAEE